MPRYLSEAWFVSVATYAAATPAATADLVLEQVVRDTPDGTVTYRVVVSGADARILWPVPTGAPTADLRITSDWATAVSVARGELSTQRALMEGRLRFRGRPDRLASIAATLAGLDPVPAQARAATTFGET